MAALWLTYSGCVWSAYGVYSATVQSYNKSIIALPRVGQYGKIFSSLVLYCPSLRSGQYCHHRAEYFPILPSQSCNNIYLLLEFHEKYFTLRSPTEHSQHCLSLMHPSLSDHYSTTYGVNRDSILNSLMYFNVCDETMPPTSCTTFWKVIYNTK